MIDLNNLADWQSDMGYLNPDENIIHTYWLVFFSKLKFCGLFIFLLIQSSLTFSQTKYTFPVYIAYENDDLIKKSSVISGIQEKIYTQRYSSSIAKDITKDSLVIAIGFDNLSKLVIANTASRILAVGVSSSSFNDLVHKSQYVSAIYVEPSPESQFRLINLINGHRDVQVTFIYSSRTEALVPIIQTASQSFPNINLVLEKVTSNNDVYKIINNVSSRFVLAYPDKNIYSQSSMRNVMLNLYRHNQAIIGFSKSMVVAGAIGSAFPSEDGYVKQVVEMVQIYSVTGALPPPNFPKYISNAVNLGVARSLNYVLQDDFAKEVDVLK